NETWQKAVAMAGLPKGTCFHHCRHTFASWHMMAGTSETALQQLGGWRSESSMKRYTHLSQAHKAKAVKALDGMY
ncbi:MAG: tyrosine-type recombinase/integrase, partial [Gammaproteobacteria bacterium]